MAPKPSSTRRDLLRLSAAASASALLARCGSRSVILPPDASFPTRDAGDAGDALVDTGMHPCPTGTLPAMFPAGLAPFEATNLAPVPQVTNGSPCPEQLVFRVTTWTTPAGDRISSVHARGYIQTPIADAFRAARDPQTGRDPTASQGFAVLEWAFDPAYLWSYRTHVRVDAIVTLMWDLEWRHGVVVGTADAPQVTATRWVKTAGSGEIAVIEGSLILSAIDGEPDLTEVLYQYHLQAPLSGPATIMGYLNVIFGRLRDRAHNRTLDPNDCMGCPPAPAGY